MMMNLRNMAIISVAISLYSFVMLYFIDPFVFLNDSDSNLSGLVLATLINLLIIVLFAVIGAKLASGLGRIIFTSGILTAAIISSFLVYVWSGGEGNLMLFLSAFVFIAILPTAIFIMLFVYFDVKDKIQVVTEKEESPSNKKRQLLKLSNEKGKLILEVELERVICFEANDNYVITYYLTSNDTVDKSMERISLKRIEESIHDLDKPFARVHKSYIINPIFVSKITGRSQAYKIELEHIHKSVPVSRNFNIELLSA